MSEITREDIAKAHEQIARSIQNSNREYVLRPSGLLRRWEGCPHNFTPEERVVIETAQSIAMIKGMLHYSEIRDRRSVSATMFIAGYLYEADPKSNVRSVLNNDIQTDYLTNGYPGITAEAVEEFVRLITDDMVSRSLIAILDDRQAIGMIASASWAFGRRIRRWQEDGDKLRDLFETEGLTDVEL